MTVVSTAEKLNSNYKFNGGDRLTNLAIPMSSKLAHENELINTSNFKQAQN